MANLAIRGHETRGKEVIEILEMLGGKNTACFSGEDMYRLYYISFDKHICIDVERYAHEKFYKITLEEFLEKFPYKVGDKVMTDEGDITNVVGMIWDNDINDVFYKIQICNEIFNYPKELLQPYKEETTDMEGVYARNEINCYHQDFGDKVRIRLGGDFEIKVEGKLTYIVRKKPNYPKTYEECCGVLGMTYDYPDIRMVSIVESNLYSSFIQLIRCRNAYWKVAGEEMGFGKPWKPDWANYNEYKYCLYITENNVNKGIFYTDNNILAFPTEEMRDAFYENFKDLIEECKEFL